MPPERRKGRKKRVDFRQNRQQRRRSDDWTQRYHTDEEELNDERSVESVRAKGELSRKRTVVVDENEAPIVDETQWRHGTITTVHGLICRVADDASRTWDCTVRRILRTLMIEQRAGVTVGDRVWFSDQSKFHDEQPVGVIERVEERKSVLSRRDRRQREHALVANADQLLIVASVAQPALKPHLIDRYLVAAGKGDLRPIICFNKCDLAPERIDLSESEAEEAATFRPEISRLEEQSESQSPSISGNDQDQPEDDELLEDVEDLDDDFFDDEEDEFRPAPLSLDDAIAEFRALGYTCIRTSAVAGVGLDELRRELTGHMTVLSGQSGVGKSSLINALQPGLDLLVRAVSAETEKGRHTTSLARLLRLDFGGWVVDTPGIRQFDLWSVAPGELEAYFLDFVPHLSNCRFKDCHHQQEEGCAVMAAVAAGRISPRRYYSYLKLLSEMARK